MNQKTNHVFRVGDLDWKGLEATGISRQMLEESGNMELLLQGEESEALPLKLRTPLLYITMDATLRIVEGPEGKPVMEIDGIGHELENKEDE
ncbi:DUF4099 domain-containing protein [Bacteroides reticulotermitis]|uniref:DUF4099 domain-containing protein n=2 Tax=Bacteroides reticulotermitis TaxID=1133319 RepID=W4UUS3_9BACE|nr:DUF4099 domain-containing protein [Bacteroides reticulotermitis]GAE84950.1 hypothetical protein JCM10512_3333 [Bacteroides reticulotermitis JCM 10512]